MSAKKQSEQQALVEKRRKRKEARERRREQARREAAQSGQRILRLADVEACTGLKYAILYERMNEGTFPRSIRLGPKAVGWLQSEIDAWVAARVAERDQGTAVRSQPLAGPRRKMEASPQEVRDRRQARGAGRGGRRTTTQRVDLVEG